MRIKDVYVLEQWSIKMNVKYEDLKKWCGRENAHYMYLQQKTGKQLKLKDIVEPAMGKEGVYRTPKKKKLRVIK